MIRVQSLIQWDVRRGGDVEVLGDLKNRPARDRGRRLRELALLGLLAERHGFVIGGDNDIAQLAEGRGGLKALTPAGPPPAGLSVVPPELPRGGGGPGRAQEAPVDVEALDDFMGDMLGGLE